MLKKIILWFLVYIIGSLVVLLLLGVNDLSEIAKETKGLGFGLYIGLIVAYLPPVLTKKTQKKGA